MFLKYKTKTQCLALIWYVQDRIISQSVLSIARHDICQKNYATAVWGTRILRKKRVNRDISQFATKERKWFEMA